MAAVTATGVPKPAAPSKKAPKAKAISSSCSRRSWVMPAMESCSTWKLPFFSVSWCRKMMLSTIQPMGSRPVSPPSSAARPAMPAGMPKANTAIKKALSRPAAAAMWAFQCSTPRPSSMTTTGTAATRVLSPILSKGL